VYESMIFLSALYSTESYASGGIAIEEMSVWRLSLCLSVRLCVTLWGGYKLDRHLNHEMAFSGFQTKLFGNLQCCSAYTLIAGIM